MSRFFVDRPIVAIVISILTVVIGVATDCSMVSASAPVYVVVRLICGGKIWGNCAIGSPRRDTTPTSTVMIAMTIATIGRRTKKADMLLPG